MLPISRRFLARVAALLVLAAVPLAARPAAAQDTVVFAAASLKNALDTVAQSYKAETGKSVTISYAASSALARQIEAGAPADIFISADLEWMDWAQGKGLVKEGTRANLLGNRLVLVGPAGGSGTVEMRRGVDLGKVLGADGRLAMGQVASVPAGKYGKAALESLGAWDGVKSRLAEQENVRAALALVARGEVPAGIVYATDAMAEPKVRVLGTFPADSHPPIVYPVAQVAASANPAARAFLTYLSSPAAARLFEGAGFTMAAKGS